MSSEQLPVASDKNCFLALFRTGVKVIFFFFISVSELDKKSVSTHLSKPGVIFPGAVNAETVHCSATSSPPSGLSQRLILTPPLKSRSRLWTICLELGLFCCLGGNWFWQFDIHVDFVVPFAHGFCRLKDTWYTRPHIAHVDFYFRCHNLHTSAAFLLAASHTNNTTQDQAHSFYAGKAWLLMVLLCVGPPCRRAANHAFTYPHRPTYSGSSQVTLLLVPLFTQLPQSRLRLSDCLTFFCFLTFYNGYHNVSSKKWKCLLERLTHYFGCIWSPSLVHSFLPLPVSLWIGLKGFIVMGSSLNSVFL